MNRVSATELKNRVSDILNEVIFTGSETIIERHGRPVAKIIPLPRSNKRSMADIKKALDESFGSMPDFPDVTKFRRSRRRKIPALF